MNIQPIEKLAQREDGTLEVHSFFYTIQGEGPFTGKPAVFIRLAGCNLRCPGCDTDYTSARKTYAPKDLFEAVKDLMEDEGVSGKCKLIVITGGEPFRQNLSILANMFAGRDYTVQIETNGTLPAPEGLMHRNVVIVCSPKTGKLNAELIPRIHALKYVAKAGQIGRDGIPTRALDHTCSPCLAKPPEDFKGTVYLQPMDECSISANKANLKSVVDACLHSGHTLQLQVHKIANVE